MCVLLLANAAAESTEDAIPQDITLESHFPWDSLEQAVAYQKGDTSRVKVTVREIPVPHYTAADIRNIRLQQGLSQRAFAVALGVSARTVEAWETVKNAPSGPSMKLIYLTEQDAETVKRLVKVG